MKKKMAALMMTLAMASAMFAGCGSTGSTQTAGASSEAETTASEAETAASEAVSEAVSSGSDVQKIGYSCGTLGDEYLRETGDYLKADCEAAGIEYTEMSAEGSSATQATQIENLVTMGCDAICICPIDATAIESSVKAAKDAGVKVIYCGVPEDFSDQSVFDVAINCDQYDYGYKAAEAASEWIDATFPDAADGSIEVAIFYNSSNALFQKRDSGFDAITELNSKTTVVETFDMIGQDNAAAKAQEYADTLFVAHPDVKVILAFSSVIGTSIDEVAMRTDCVDPANFGIFASDWLAAGGDAIVKSETNESTFRCLVSCADLGHAFYDCAVGEAEADETGFYALPLTTVTVENIDEEMLLHE